MRCERQSLPDPQDGPSLAVQLLGPVKATVGGSPLTLGGTHARAVLAVLALHAGRPVALDVLIDALWGDDPPPSAVKTARAYVSRLRSALGRDHIVPVLPGYLLDLPPDQIDALAFGGRAAEGQRLLSAGRPQEAAAVLRSALGLWRGPPCAGLEDVPGLRGALTRLEEERLVALEHLMEAEVAAGRAADVVGTLEELVAEHPLREGFWACLMRAFYDSGRKPTPSTPTSEPAGASSSRWASSQVRSCETWRTPSSARIYPAPIPPERGTFRAT